MGGCPHCGERRKGNVAVISGGNVVISNRLVVVDDSGSCEVPPPVDFDVLFSVIEALEEELSSNGLIMPPAEKAEAISGLYELALEDLAVDDDPDLPGDDS